MLFALGNTNLPRGIPPHLRLLRIPDNFVSTVEIQSLQIPIRLWESSSLSKSNPPPNCVNPPISIVLVLKPNQNQIIFKHTALFSATMFLSSPPENKKKTKSSFTTNFSWLQNLLLEIDLRGLHGAVVENLRIITVFLLWKHGPPRRHLFLLLGSVWLPIHGWGSSLQRWYFGSAFFRMQGERGRC